MSGFCAAFCLVLAAAFGPALAAGEAYREANALSDTPSPGATDLWAQEALTPRAGPGAQALADPVPLMVLALLCRRWLRLPLERRVSSSGWAAPCSRPLFLLGPPRQRDGG